LSNVQIPFTKSESGIRFVVETGLAVPVPRVAPPLVNETEPVGAAASDCWNALILTKAVNVTLWPAREGFTLDNKVVEVVTGLTVKLWVMAVAGKKSALPTWVAWMVQVPTVTTLTVAPETVQTPVVVDAKLTGKPELADAFTANGATPNVWFANAANEIVCGAGLMVSVVEPLAELLSAFPLYVAVTV
jgi:hypothetical protein